MFDLLELIFFPSIKFNKNIINYFFLKENKFEFDKRFPSKLWQNAINYFSNEWENQDC